MSSSSQTPVRLSSEQKLAAAREHVIGKIPVSDICAKFGCASSVFYKWQQTILTETAQVFDAKKVAKSENTQVKALQERNDKIMATLALREQAIAELVADNIRLKKIQNGDN